MVVDVAETMDFPHGWNMDLKQLGCLLILFDMCCGLTKSLMWWVRIEDFQKLITLRNCFPKTGLILLCSSSECVILCRGGSSISVILTIPEVRLLIIFHDHVVMLVTNLSKIVYFGAIGSVNLIVVRFAIKNASCYIRILAFTLDSLWGSSSHGI